MKDNPNEERILDAALKVVSRETLAGTRTRMIAEEAKVTPSSIHYYFKSKEDLLDRLQKKVVDEGILFKKRQNRDFAPHTMEEALDLFFVQKMDYILLEKEYDFVNFDFWLQTRVDEKMRSSLAEGYSRWRQEIRQKVIEPFASGLPEFDKEQLSRTIVSLMQGAALQYHLEGFDLQGYFSYCKMIVSAMMQRFEGNPNMPYTVIPEKK